MPFLVFKLSKVIPKDLLIDSNSSINTDIMNFLSIDCSIDIGSLFVKTKNKTFSKILQSDKSNNDLLMKKILDFFKENNLKFGDISKIFVNQGPGNFSGLRGSLAIAKGVSLSKNLNLFGYNTFIWSCAKFFNKKDSIFSLIKFREKYFIKKFDKNLKSISKIEEVTVDEIINKYNNKFNVIPKNVVKYFDEKILKLNNLSIVDLDHNELEFLQLKGLLDEELIKPLYLS
jgi:tRNA threonylcarbamoyl adenosine modification protein YeaZ